MGPCLVFPYLDPGGAVMEYVTGGGTARPFVRLKPDHPRKAAKDKDRPIKYESPLGATCRAYVPPGTRAALADPTVPLIVTEGEKKSLCADQVGLPCIGLGGVWAWQVARPEDANGRKIGPRELIPDLDGIAWHGRPVTIIYDSDITTKPEVQWARWYLAEALRDEGATVRVVDLPTEPGGQKNGLDDFVVRHGAEALRTLIAAALPPARPERDDPRPTVVITTEEYRTNAEAILALASEPDLYQRAGMLVRVAKADGNPSRRSAVRRPPGTPVVRELRPAVLRERMTRCARWVTLKKVEEQWEQIPAHPPDWSVAAVHARAEWVGIRHLEAVVNHPVLLQDGSILTTHGYDPHSGLLVSISSGLRLSVPTEPTPADVAAAVATIDDVLGDFPFERPEHRGAWYAGLLTPLAWFAFDGPAPLLLIDGNVRGVGKGLLADVIALILTGRRFPVMSYTSDREELRKKITSLAMEGERLVLLDNLAGAVGNDVLDMALTADRWKDRVLGVNRVYDGPLHVNWYATGNNVQLHADTARRCSHCRLETASERPELRDDVKYPDLRRYVLASRAALLSAALTILRGWYAAGQPRHKGKDGKGLAPWGSFEGWSGVVREVVVHAGLPDPGETRLALQTTADRDALTMSAMLDALEQMDPCRRGVTTAEVIEAIRQHDRRKADDPPPPGWHALLKSAVEDLCGKLDGRLLGYRFRHFQRRNFGGRMLDKASAPHGSVRWVVLPVGRPADAHHAHHAHPCDPPAGGDGGHGGDDPAASGAASGDGPDVEEGLL
jgi:hypothetical protein